LNRVFHELGTIYSRTAKELADKELQERVKEHSSVVGYKWF